MGAQCRGVLLYAVALAALILVHVPFFATPYFWDELGQFAPAAFDIYSNGSWIPRSTLPNVHPPAVIAWVALAWRLAGFSIPTARIAMLVLAAAGLAGTFALSTRFSPAQPMRAGVLAAVLLFASPLFWSQSMMVQLDMPAMVLTILALILFLDERWPVSALVCALLVLAKETAIVVPAVFAAKLLWERKTRAATWFVIPVIALAAWLAALRLNTGYWLGNSAFGDYNVWYPLHPVRLLGALFRRVYYLFFASFHWVGAIAITAGWRAGLYKTPKWRIAGWLFIALVLSVTLLGGAALERYLLPALPLLYCAIAAALCRFRVGWRTSAALAAAMSVCIFLNPPYPFPLENNLAWTDSANVQQHAAQFLAEHYSNAQIATSWPFTDALSRGGFGYVSTPLNVHRLSHVGRESADVVVLYSTTWNPRWGLLRIKWVERALSRYWGYRPEVTGAALGPVLNLRCVGRWERRGQWIETWAKKPVTGLGGLP
jgi:hypothetical protein